MSSLYNRKHKSGILDTVARTATNLADIVEDLSELSSATISLGTIKVDGMIIEEKLEQIATLEQSAGESNAEFRKKCNEVRSKLLDNMLSKLSDDL